MGFLYTLLWIVLVIIAIGIAIFIHELGHFLAARVSKIKVKEFSIGFGPRIMHKSSKKGDFTFSFRWFFALGGYVMVDSYQLRRLNYKEQVADKIEQDGTIAGHDKKQIKSEIKSQMKAVDANGNEFFYKMEPLSGTDKVYEDVRMWRKLIFLLAGIVFNFIFFMIVAPLYLWANGLPVNFVDFFKTIGDTFVHFFGTFKVIINPLAKGISAESLPGLVANGPKDIAQYGKIFVSLLLSFNLSLFILNVLPIPPLDGWKFVTTFYETWRKKPIPDTVQIVLSLAGIVLLLWFTVAVTINNFAVKN